MHAVIFDIDGTLLQSNLIDDDLYRASLQHVLGPIRFRDEISDYEFVSDSGILWQVLADNDLTTLPDPTSEIVDHFVAALRQHISENGAFREVPGARSFFAALHSSPDHYVAIATGGWSVSAKLKLYSAGFDLNGIRLSSSDNERARTAIMRSALDRKESEYDSVTYYGDGPWDETACSELGWNFIAVGPALGGIDSYVARDKF